MPLFEFTTFITIEADSHEDAIRWFDYKTEDLETYVAEIEEKI
jgi:hypothetical protein